MPPLLLEFKGFLPGSQVWREIGLGFFYLFFSRERKVVVSPPSQSLTTSSWQSNQWPLNFPAQCLPTFQRCCRESSGSNIRGNGYFHQSVKLPAFRQSSSNFKVRLVLHQIITAIPRSTLSPELNIWRRTETYCCPLWKQHGCQAD